MWSCLAVGCFTVLGGCWCDILNVHENRFREELECVLSEFSKYHTKVLLRDSVLRLPPYVDKIIEFRAVFWDILPCKMIVDRRFSGAYCRHHLG
jgi:hypothetical protein